MSEIELAELNVKIAYDEMDDACEGLVDAWEMVEESFRELKEAVVKG